MTINKSIQCQECGKSFNQKGNLKRHKDTIHLGLKKFCCEFCQKEFSKKDNMMHHISKLHDKTLTKNNQH